MAKNHTESQASENPSHPINPSIEKEIPLEDFSPVGTMTLTMIYFLILVVMWAFMYFIEFVGHGPSILE
jgi:hypothetical protein